MRCELCGKETALFLAVVEGTQLQLCAECGRFGKILHPLKQASPAQKSAPIKREPTPIERIVDDYAQRIRAAREKRGLTQEDFAKLILVKESLVHKMETGHFEPPIDLARRLEKLLRITLVEVREESAVVPAQQGGPRPEGLTIGDLFKLKR
jgi:putative transcription factor